MKAIEEYRPLVHFRTGKVLLVYRAIAPPAGWRMPLHSEKEYWYHGRIREVHYGAPRIDDPWDLRLIE